MGQATLSRFYALHVVVLPLVAFDPGAAPAAGSIARHEPGGRPAHREDRALLPLFVLKDFSLWGMVFLVVFVFALCLPSRPSSPIPSSSPSIDGVDPGIKPEWYFFFVYYPLELLPFWLVMIVTNGVLAMLLLAPGSSGARNARPSGGSRRRQAPTS